MHANAERASRRGYLVFATDPSVHPDDPGYREVYATEAKTPAQAVRKVRALAGVQMRPIDSFHVTDQKMTVHDSPAGLESRF